MLSSKSRQVATIPASGRAKTSARMESRHAMTVDRAGFEPHTEALVSLVVIATPKRGFEAIWREGKRKIRLKSGADPCFVDGSSWARRDFRPTTHLRPKPQPFFLNQSFHFII